MDSRCRRHPHDERTNPVKGNTSGIGISRDVIGDLPETRHENGREASSRWEFAELLSDIYIGMCFFDCRSCERTIVHFSHRSAFLFAIYVSRANHLYLLCIRTRFNRSSSFCIKCLYE